MISGRQVFSNESIRYDALFPSATLPDTCGDRLWRCDVTRVKDPPNNREVVLAPHPDGVAMALFTDVNNDRFSLQSQFVARPQETINCSMTSFTGDSRLFAACMRFNPSHTVEFEVELWLFEVHINFDALNETTLVLLNDVNTPYRSYSSGLSAIFNVVTGGENHVIWLDDEILFTIQLPSLDPEIFFADTNHNVCFGNNVTDVRLSDDQHNLLVYCSQNTLVDVSVRDRGGMTISVNETLTRFYCPQAGYLEERNDTLAFVTPGLTDHVIPHPLNLSERYVGDCVVVDQTVWFIGTSADGLVVLTDVLNNKTIVLSYNAPTRHKVDGHILLYSNSTLSGLLDLACPSQLLLSNQTFLLSTFELNPGFMCPEQPTVGVVNQTPPTALIIGLSVLGFLTLTIIACAAALLCCCKCLYHLPLSLEERIPGKLYISCFTTNQMPCFCVYLCTAAVKCISLRSDFPPTLHHFNAPLDLYSAPNGFAVPSTNGTTFGDEERVFASSVPLPPDPSLDTQETTSSSPPSPTHPLGVTPHPLIGFPDNDGIDP